MRITAAFFVTAVLFLFTPARPANAEGVDQIAKGLKAESPDQRIHAAEQLKELGPLAAPAVPALIEALHDKNLSVQHEALLALEHIGPAARGAVGELIGILQKNDRSRLHSGAIEALGAIGSEAASAVPVLKKLLVGKDVHLATAAGLALSEILPAGSEQLAEVVPVLVKSLANTSPEIRNQAIFGLGACGRQALPTLTKLVAGHDKNHDLAWQAAAALALLGPDAEPAIPDLVSALKSKQQSVVAQSAAALGAIGPAAKGAVPQLQALLAHKDIVIREYAANALGNMGAAAAGAVPDLTKMLKDENEDIRRIAAGALGRIGPDAETAIPALIAALDDERGPVALHAAEALGQIGPNAVPHLAKALADPRRQQLAVMVLAEMGPASKPAAGALADALSEHDGQESEQHLEMCREILITLAHIGPDAKPAVPALLKILGNEKHELRGGAAWALANIGAKEAIPWLKKALESNDGSKLQLVAPVALMVLEPEDEEYVRLAVPSLGRALENPSGSVRREAATILARIGPKAAPAVDKLAAVLADPDPSIRNAVLMALASIGPDSTGAIPQILAEMSDRNNSVRYSAIFALGKIGKTARQALPILEKNLQDSDAFLQTASAWAILQIDAKEGQKRATQCLKPLMNGLAIPDPRVRNQVVKALGLLGPAAKPAVKALQEISKEKDLDETIGKSVAEALEKIGG
jgi:HEAT repeat protein